MTAPDWMDGAGRLASSRGGSMAGGPPRFVWHTFEADPARLSAWAGAQAIHADGNDVHFVLNPITGELVQSLPASASARGLKNTPGGVETNRMGSVCLQVEVIAFAARPFTSYLTPAGRAAVGGLVRFARAHGIPDVWPAGPPPAYPGGFSVRSCGTWTGHAGHFGHSQVPENDHGDPGAIDVAALFACAPQPSPAPSRPTVQGVPMGYYLPTQPYRPGDGVLFVDGTGVYPLSAARWAVLRSEGAPAPRTLPDDQWDALRAEAQPPIQELRRAVSDLTARINALIAPPGA